MSGLCVLFLKHMLYQGSMELLKPVANEAVRRAFYDGKFALFVLHHGETPPGRPITRWLQTTQHEDWPHCIVLLQDRNAHTLLYQPLLPLGQTWFSYAQSANVALTEDRVRISWIRVGIVCYECQQQPRRQPGEASI